MALLLRLVRGIALDGGRLHPELPLGLLGPPQHCVDGAASVVLLPGDEGVEKLKTSEAPSTASRSLRRPFMSAELLNSSCRVRLSHQWRGCPRRPSPSLQGLWLADRFSTRATSGDGTPVHVTQERTVRAQSLVFTSLPCAHTHTKVESACLPNRLNALVPTFCCMRPAAAHCACLTALCTSAARCQRSGNSIYFQTTGFIWSFLNTSISIEKYSLWSFALLFQWLTYLVKLKNNGNCTQHALMLEQI